MKLTQTLTATLAAGLLATTFGLSAAADETPTPEKTTQAEPKKSEDPKPEPKETKAPEKTADPEPTREPEPTKTHEPEPEPEPTKAQPSKTHEPDPEPTKAEPSKTKDPEPDASKTSQSPKPSESASETAKPEPTKTSTAPEPTKTTAEPFKAYEVTVWWKFTNPPAYWPQIRTSNPGNQPEAACQGAGWQHDVYWIRDADDEAYLAGLHTLNSPADDARLEPHDYGFVIVAEDKSLCHTSPPPSSEPPTTAPPSSQPPTVPPSSVPPSSEPPTSAPPSLGTPSVPHESTPPATTEPPDDDDEPTCAGRGHDIPIGDDDYDWRLDKDRDGIACEHHHRKTHHDEDLTTDAGSYRAPAATETLAETGASSGVFWVKFLGVWLFVGSLVSLAVGQLLRRNGAHQR